MDKNIQKETREALLENFDDSIEELKKVLPGRDQKELMVALAEGLKEWGLPANVESRLVAIRTLYPPHRSHGRFGSARGSS